MGCLFSSNGFDEEGGQIGKHLRRRMAGIASEKNEGGCRSEGGLPALTLNIRSYGV